MLNALHVDSAFLLKMRGINMKYKIAQAWMIMFCSMILGGFGYAMYCCGKAGFLASGAIAFTAITAWAIFTMENHDNK